MDWLISHVFLHTGPSVLAAFLASLVEFVEALTVILAAGSVRGWVLSTSCEVSRLSPASELHQGRGGVVNYEFAPEFGGPKNVLTCSINSLAGLSFSATEVKASSKGAA